MLVPAFLRPRPRPPTVEERAAKERQIDERCRSAVAWSPDMRWDPNLTLRADTYHMRSLFPGLTPTRAPLPGAATVGSYVDSPSGIWRYVEKRLIRGGCLRTFYGKERGNVMFDGPIVVPALHARLFMEPNSRWDENPWMSLTPMEMFTLRGGTRLAKGRVVLTGLGLGHQLIDVSHRKSVTHLTLVERSAELVKWLLPHIRPFLGRPLDEVIVGDANEVLPKLTADVALLDHFANYGSNGWARDRLKRAAPNIKRWWAWGSSDLGD